MCNVVFNRNSAVKNEITQTDGFNRSISSINKLVAHSRSIFEGLNLLKIKFHMDPVAIFCFNQLRTLEAGLT